MPFVAIIAAYLKQAIDAYTFEQAFFIMYQSATLTDEQYADGILARVLQAVEDVSLVVDPLWEGEVITEVDLRRICSEELRKLIAKVDGAVSPT